MNLRQHRLELLALGLGAFALATGLHFWKLGSQQCAPRHEPVGDLPADLSGENVSFRGSSGSLLRGWFLPGEGGRGAAVLMHPVRSNRAFMLRRARFLNAAGYAVLLFDFQAHGESEGEWMTFGHLESQDAHAAVAWLRERVPGERIVAVGASLGGAATLLADPPLAVDRMVLEMVYPTIQEATANRLKLRFGRLGQWLTPLLTWQLKPRTGVGVRQLRPVDHVGRLGVPKLFIAGTQDLHTTMGESWALFEAAAQPKQFWAVEGARHEDLHGFDQQEYERRVLRFLE